MWTVVRYKIGVSPEVVASFKGFAKASAKAQELGSLSKDRDERFMVRLQTVRSPIADFPTESKWRTRTKK